MHLVVSKNKNTWSSNDTLLFAGPWCYPKKDDNNESLILYEEETKNYHTKVDKQWEKIFEYKNKLFPLICSVINDYRKENNTERYYRIIIGHWFDYAIEILYHKILLATKLKEIYNYKSFSYLFSENYPIAPFSESEFMDAHFDDRWNQALFGIILEKIKFSDLQIRKLTDHKTSDFAIPKRKSNSLKNMAYKINYLFGEFSSNNDALIINSYLPFFEELKLKLFLKQIPIITRKVSFDREFSYNHNLRVELTDKLLSKINTGDKILNTILHVVFLIFPIIFLEGFDDIRGFVNKLNWPKNPKFIFTSNNFFADNVFKLWAAQKTKKNIKFFIGQHGPYWLQINSINNQVYSSCEEITADKLICNGLENSNNKIPGIYFPITKPKQIPFKKSGNISFIMPPLAYFGYKKSWSSVYWDNFREYGEWTDKVIKLFRTLNNDVKKIFYLRLYSHISQHNFINKRWKEKIGTQNIYSDKYSINTIYRKSKLVIICFESRSLQETMIQNVPTLILFDHFMIKQMRKENLIKFNILKKAGILFTDFQKVTHFLNENLNNIDQWWNSDEVQNAREEFTEKYSRTVKSPTNYLSKLFQENL